MKEQRNKNYIQYVFTVFKNSVLRKRENHRGRKWAGVRAERKGGTEKITRGHNLFGVIEIFSIMIVVIIRRL